MLVHHRVIPSIKFAGTHLYSWVERGTATVRCLAQEHNRAQNPDRSIRSRAHQPLRSPFCKYCDSLEVCVNGVTTFSILSLTIRLRLIKGILMHTFAGNVGCLYAETVDISLLEPIVDFKSTSKDWTARATLRTVIKYFQSWRKRKAPVCSRVAGKK